MKTVHIDVRCGGYLVFTLHYRYCPAFKINMQDVYDKIIEKRPTLRDKQIELYFD